jgi:hypothetical protein
MKSDYYPPKCDELQFHCIRCNVFSSQSWHNIYFQAGNWIETPLRGSHCKHCKDWTIWHGEKMILPSESPVEHPHPDLPTDCLTEYLEARSVFSLSPRASAALLRLCIQKRLPHLEENGRNINEDIKSLVEKGLPVLVQKALDICRVVSNNAVHPGEIDINDTPEIAQNLFRMINFIVEDRITRPKEIIDLYNELPQNSRDAIARRDGNDSI